MYPAGILFDLDDTIILSGGWGETVWAEVSRKFVQHQGGLSEEALIEAIREVRTWFWSDTKRHERGRLNLDKTRFEIALMALEKLGYPDRQGAQAIAEEFTSIIDQKTCFFPGAEDTLAALKAKGVKLALLTNGAREKQRAKIQKFKLERFFDVILIEGELGYGKPDPKVYEKALADLALEASQTWMIGDNLEWDVAGPQRMGIYGIWNDYRKEGLKPGSSVVPDRIVHSIAALR